MVELFSIGHFSIHLLSVTSALGMIIGLLMIQKEGERKNLDKDKLMNLSMITVFSGIIGARIGYILFFNFSHYVNNPAEIIRFSQGGLSIQGAILGGGAMAFWYINKAQLPVWQTADAVVPGIILGQAIGRVGCDVFGVPMQRNWPWGVMVNGELLHPAQLYEAGLNLLLFLYIWKKRQSAKHPGQLFFIYLIGFAVNRFIVEFFRTNPKVTDLFSIAHLLSTALIAIGIIGLFLLKNKKETVFSSDTEAISLSNVLVYTFIVIGFISAVIFYYGIHYLYSR